MSYKPTNGWPDERILLLLVLFLPAKPQNSNLRCWVNAQVVAGIWQISMGSEICTLEAHLFLIKFILYGFIVCSTNSVRCSCVHFYTELPHCKQETIIRLQLLYYFTEMNLTSCLSLCDCDGRSPIETREEEEKMMEMEKKSECSPFLILPTCHRTTNNWPPWNHYFLSFNSNHVHEVITVRGVSYNYNADHPVRWHRISGKHVRNTCSRIKHLLLFLFA